MRRRNVLAVPAILGALAASQATGPAWATSPNPVPTSPAITLVLPSPLPSLSLTLPPAMPAASPPPGLIQLPTEVRTVPEMQAALLDDVNRERATAGLPPVTTQPWAQAVALGHAQDMAAARDIWHNYTGYVDVAHQAIDAYVNGENVGMALTLDTVDAALMASPGHRANILYPLFNAIGIGVARDSIGYVYVTEDFADIRPASASVADRPAAAPAPAHPAAAPAPSPTPVAPAPAIATPVVFPTPAPPAAAPAPAGASPAAATDHVRRPAAVALGLLLLVAAGVSVVVRRRHHQR